MLKLVKGDKVVWVADDPAEPSHVYWREQGFAPEGESAPAPKAKPKRKKAAAKRS